MIGWVDWWNMLREHSKLLIRFHMLADVFLVIIAFIAAYHTKRNFIFPGYGLSTEPNYYLVLLIAVVTAFFSFSATGCYQPYRTQTLLQIYTRVIRAVVGVLFGTIIFLYLLHDLFLELEIIFPYAPDRIEKFQCRIAEILKTNIRFRFVKT